MNLKEILLGLVALAIIGLMTRWVVEFWKVDKCLDRGGGWDYQARECEEGREPN